MTLELPQHHYTDQKPTDVASYLRELEQNCAKTTPRDVRSALLLAAEEIERWRDLSKDAARQLTEAANVRISAMASASNVEDVQRGVKSTMLELARQFRELA